MTRHLLHISDCHLVRPDDKLIGVDTEDSLRHVLEAALLERAPAAVVASGDLAHVGEEAVYRRFRSILLEYTQAPLLCLPGNHDILAQMQAAQLPFEPLEVGPWGVVWLDSHIDDEAQARVDPRDRAQVLAQIKASTARHLIVATHHPLVVTNTPWIDKDRIQKPAELVQWLAESSVRDDEPRLQACVFGHAHQVVCASLPNGYGGAVSLWGVPSTCFQFLPGSERFTLDTAGPGYAWLSLEDDGRIERRVERISYPIDAQVGPR